MAKRKVRVFPPIEARVLGDAFHKENVTLTLLRVRTSCLLAAPLFLLFAAMDYIQERELFPVFLLLRICAAAVLGFIGAATYRGASQRHGELLGVVVWASLGITLTVMISLAKSFGHMYTQGLFLILIAVSLIMPWRLRYSALTYGLIYGSYILFNARMGRLEDPIFLNNNMFLLTIVVLSLTATHISFRLRFSDFKSRASLSEANRELGRSRQQLEEAYLKLQDLDRAKSEFFANISHELRTPLTLILAPLESFLKGEGGSAQGSFMRHAEVMHQNGLRLLKQINNLLDLTKLDAGRMVLSYSRGDLAAFLRGVVASVAPMAEKKHVRLKGEEASSLPQHAYFDRDRLEKVVLNLVFNAIKFTDSGGSVTVSWGCSTEGHLWVRVSDTGIGIAERDLPKLFKRFSQVDASSSRRYEGTGIGLALAKEIVELHGGHIGVESEPGRGSNFTFSVPLLLEPPDCDSSAAVNDQKQPEETTSPDWTSALHLAAERQVTGIVSEPTLTAEPSLSPSNGRQILVVEDNPDMREFVAVELQGEYRVRKAANGVEGLRTATEVLPDLIVSDVMMPEMDGYQLCREIRTDPRTMHIPIILLTARADIAMKIEGLEHGADDYLTKPFNAQELRAKIKSLLEQRRLEREIQQRNEALEAALTELKNTQTQLVQSEKMAGLGLLVAGMAHEINNPINFAKNSLSVLERAWEDLKPFLDRERMSPDGVDSVEDVEASLGIVKNGVARTEQIVGQLKSFVRKDENQRIACSVQEGLASTLELIRPMMGGQIALHADLQSSGRVFAVPGKLNQVWMNLLQNAVHAVGESGAIWVESRDHEHMVTVTVRDSGPGIAPEHLPRLFEPFFTTKPVGQGTGLGLSVSYQIVQDAEGRIDVKSQPGQGSEFTVVLPLADVLSQAA